MIPRAERLLRHLKDETRRTANPSEPVLKAADGVSNLKGPYLSKRFREMCVGAQVSRVGIHGLRHSYAVELLHLGASLVTIKDELGQKQIETTMKYLTVAPRDRAEATLRLFGS